jgi:hypothetical protein
MSEDNNDIHSYQYFLLGERVPVRVPLDEDGLRMGAESPDPQTGELVIKNTLLSRLDQSPEVEEITQEKFDEICDGLKKNRPDLRAHQGPHL